MKDKMGILLVEDDSVDVMTIKRTFKDCNITNPLDITRNGEEALAYLRDQGNPKPGLILLDINMPKMNGIEFLKIAKKDNELRKIPVVVLTTSLAESDKMDSFDLGVAGYIVKPVEYPEFTEVMKTIHLYWMLSEGAR